MTTAIFKSYSDFLARDDKSVNGVSAEFSELHPDYEKQNETNTGCWNCSGCSYCWNCRNCSGCSDCSYCSHCSYCSYCSQCSYCSDCSRCSDCSGKTERKVTPPTIPKVDNLDVVLYEVASCPNSLDMKVWHTCENTHCRAGWIVTLAGEEGKALEAFHNTELAAMLIYRESTGRRINPSRFYDSNDDALLDMKRLAELAAPTVQGEPVAVLLIGDPEHTEQGWELGDWDIEPNAITIEAFAKLAKPGAYQLYLAPQPAEQQS